MAPLHQPLSLALAGLIGKIVPGTPVVGCFDTAFHAAMPEPATRYALPNSWVREYGLRRYGFHGLSCAYALRRCAELLDTTPDALRLLCCHLGAGVSVTAIRDGHSVDTSMGFTPLEGAAMATRSGSVDPGLLLYLLRRGVADTSGLEQALVAMSARSWRHGRPAMPAPRWRSRCTCTGCAARSARRRWRWTGWTPWCSPGASPNTSRDLVAELVDGLTVLGLAVDPARLQRAGDRVISPPTATSVLVVAARDDLEIARQTTAAVTAHADRLR